MSNIHIKHNHSLSHEETRQRVEGIAKGLKKEGKIEKTIRQDIVLEMADKQGSRLS